MQKIFIKEHRIEIGIVIIAIILSITTILYTLSFKKCRESIVAEDYQSLYILYDLGLKDNVIGLMESPSVEVDIDLYNKEIEELIDLTPRIGRYEDINEEILNNLGCTVVVGSSKDYIKGVRYFKYKSSNLSIDRVYKDIAKLFNKYGYSITEYNEKDIESLSKDRIKYQ